MNRLLTVSAAIEALTGLTLLVMPGVIVWLLLGGELAGPGIPLGRVAGVALLALAVACWLARGDTQSGSASGLVAAMLLYNVGAVVVLSMAGVQSPPVGVALWPAVAIHLAMTVWCITGLLGSPERAAT